MPFKRGHIERIRLILKNRMNLTKALEERKPRYKKWKYKLARPTGIWLWSKSRNEPAPTERTAYDLAGQRKVLRLARS